MEDSIRIRKASDPVELIKLLLGKIHPWEGVSGTSLLNAVSLMAYNVFYTSIPVLVSLVDKDLSEETVMQHPQILYYRQAGRLGFFCTLST
ncbi:Phospholipid-transporting ATPase 2 [Camellia lanceoleosa]|uniref:Phospholipid-transporting ATPase 2 n=1 Tax=Camellia lanceoleosa TaxID=1840588 RepID=A0ACC0F7F0_9ERIC|nr:Phospholipid-transporting ATPase 2 [Camellia lanceoleosa]